MGTNKSTLKIICGTCKYYYLKCKTWRSRGNIPHCSTCEFLAKLHKESQVYKEDEGCSHWTPATSKYYHHGTC